MGGPQEPRKYFVCWLEKACSRCGETKPLSEFQRAGPTSPDRRKTFCKSCDARYRHDLNLVPARKAHLAVTSKQSRTRNRLRAMEFYCGGTPHCQCCGEARLEFLTFDHINGGGKIHRRSLGGHGNFYGWLVRNDFPAGFRVLCFNCNCSHGFLGYCPHDRERERLLMDPAVAGDIRLQSTRLDAIDPSHPRTLDHQRTQASIEDFTHDKFRRGQAEAGRALASR